MDSRTSRLMGPAERFYVSVTDDDRREIDRIIHNLCADPTINNKTTFVFSVPPAILSLYSDGRFWIVYHLPTSLELRVMNIGAPGEKRTVHRST